LLSFVISPRPPSSTSFPYTTLFRSVCVDEDDVLARGGVLLVQHEHASRDSRAVEQARRQSDDRFKPATLDEVTPRLALFATTKQDRKSTRLNSSHVKISYAVFCLKK